jgi:hypothetical protein
MDTIKEIQAILIRAPYLAGEHAFLFVIGLVAAGAIITGLLFYQNGYTVINMQFSGDSELRLKEDVFQSVLEEQETREAAATVVQKSSPKNIFQKKGD